MNHSLTQSEQPSTKRGPGRPPKDPKVQFGMRVRVPLAEQLEATCRQRGISLTDAFDQAIVGWLNNVNEHTN